MEAPESVGLRISIADQHATVSVVGKSTQWVTFVHRDDAADAYVKAIQLSSVIAGMPHSVFDLGAKPERPGWVMDELKKHLGYTGRIEFRDPNYSKEGAEATSVRLDCTRTKIIFAWEPKLGGLCRDIPEWPQLGERTGLMTELSGMYKPLRMAPRWSYLVLA
ncbi:MAG: hypothetical protein M1830_005618 [Pleopsidium flavum]|nr:MAG: hypothetical protein M1830_005618 [Pleopsidium flavum]